MLLAPGVIQFSKGKGRCIRASVVAQPQRLVTAQPPVVQGSRDRMPMSDSLLLTTWHVSAGREGGN